MTVARLYYESHVTIDPVPEEKRPALQALVDPWKFRLAKLFMEKGRPSDLDTFMTGHGTDLFDIQHRTGAVVRTLQAAGYSVRRYKIEDTIVDSRHGDRLFLGVGAPA